MKTLLGQRMGQRRNIRGRASHYQLYRYSASKSLQWENEKYKRRREFAIVLLGHGDKVTYIAQVNIQATTNGITAPQDLQPQVSTA
jgi:hypothetical protein